MKPCSSYNCCSSSSNAPSFLKKMFSFHRIYLKTIEKCPCIFKYHYDIDNVLDIFLWSVMKFKKYILERTCKPIIYFKHSSHISISHLKYLYIYNIAFMQCKTDSINDSTSLDCHSGFFFLSSFLNFWTNDTKAQSITQRKLS